MNQRWQIDVELTCGYHVDVISIYINVELTLSVCWDALLKLFQYKYKLYAYNSVHCPNYTNVTLLMLQYLIIHEVLPIHCDKLSMNKMQIKTLQNRESKN